MASLRTTGGDRLPILPNVVGAVVHAAPAATDDPLTVVVPGFADDRTYTISYWQSRGATLPAVGDLAIVAKTENDEPWMVAWWPADGDVPPSGGADGTQWFAGAGVPDVGLGANGDFYLRTGTGDVYLKVAGSWDGPIANLKGPPGVDGTDGTNGTDGADGTDGSDGAPGRDAGFPFYFPGFGSAGVDPGAGNFAIYFDGAEFYLQFSKTDADGADLGVELGLWDDSDSTPRGQIIQRQADAPENMVTWAVADALDDNGTWVQMKITVLAQYGTWGGGALINTVFVPSGNRGSVGATGDGTRPAARTITDVDLAAVDLTDGATVNGVTLAPDDRVLNSLSTTDDRDVYVVQAGGAPAVRALDERSSGSSVWVEEGDKWARVEWSYDGPTDEWLMHTVVSGDFVGIPSAYGYDGKVPVARYDSGTYSYAVAWEDPPITPVRPFTGGVGPGTDALGNPHTAGPGLAWTKDTTNEVRVRGSIVLGADGAHPADNDADTDDDPYFIQLMVLGHGSWNAAPDVNAVAGQSLRKEVRIELPATDGDSEIGTFVSRQTELAQSGPNCIVYLISGADDPPIPGGATVWLDDFSYRAKPD
jgi:hypothetical protein